MTGTYVDMVPFCSCKPEGSEVSLNPIQSNNWNSPLHTIKPFSFFQEHLGRLEHLWPLGIGACLLWSPEGCSYLSGIESYSSLAWSLVSLTTRAYTFSEKLNLTVVLTGVADASHRPYLVKKPSHSLFWRVTSSLNIDGLRQGSVIFLVLQEGIWGLPLPYLCHIGTKTDRANLNFCKLYPLQKRYVKILTPRTSEWDLICK